MSNAKEKEPKLFYRMAGVSLIVLICLPLAAFILSGLIDVPWSIVRTVCVICGAGVVIGIGLGIILDILEA